MEDLDAPLDIFGKLFAQRLRDRALEHFDFMLEGKWKAPGLLALQSELSRCGEREKEIMRRCLAASIDSAIHDFLFTIQEGTYDGSNIGVVVDGKDINSLSDGVHGEIFGEDGWFARFSRYGPTRDEQ